MLVKNCAIAKTGRPCPLDPDESWARKVQVWGAQLNGEGSSLRLGVCVCVCREKLPGARLEG